MRILLDQVAHDMRNKGNNSLLQAAVNRLLKFWPDAKLDVITVAPNLAKLYFPPIQSVSPHDLHPIQRGFDNINRFIPRSIWRLLFEIREEIWHRRSITERAKIQLSMDTSYETNSSLISENNYGNPTALVNSTDVDQGHDNFRANLINYDLLVASGGGYMCDHDKWLLMNMFDRFDTAIDIGIPTVITSVGVGPMADQDLLNKAKEILPKVDMILYRNKRLGLPLLKSFGIHSERIMMTGDDAIELAYNARKNIFGSWIGISLRVSTYTKVKRQQVEILKKVIQNAAKNYQTKLIGIPTSSAHHESDITHIRKVIEGYKFKSLTHQKLDSHTNSIEKVGQCRLMISGTYHGAIYALSQGIPVVGVANSGEYFDKLAELSDEFGPGCNVILLDDEKLENNLTSAIEKAWNSAEEIRPSLLETSTRLINLQCEGYRRIYKLVDERTTKKFIL